MDTKILKQRVKASTSRASEVVPPATLVQLRKDLTPARTLLTQVTTLIVEYPDAASYEEADKLLSIIRCNVKKIEKGIAPILDPLNEARKALLALKHDMQDPLDDAEQAIRSKMRAWKMQEHRALAEAEEQRQQEIEAKRQEAEEKEAAAARAKTSAVRQRLEAEALQAQVEAEVLEEEPEAPAVQVVGSGTRKVKVWEVADLEQVIAGVTEGKIPLDVLTVDRAKVTEYFRESQTEVASWPGFLVKDDVRIVGR